MRLRVLGVVVALVGLAVSPARAEVHLTIADGRVTISAKDATIRQILAEWARVGQTRFVNAERVSGAPLSIELTDIPEAQALDTILRSVSGYLAAPRAVPSATASTYDRVFLLPTSTAAARASAGPPQAQPGFNPPPAFTPPPQDDPDDDEVVRQPGPPPGVTPPNAPRGPAFTTFPPPPQFPQQRQAPQPPQPQAQPSIPAPPTTFGAPPPGVGPIGVTTPGMVVPTPQQQQDPGGDRR